MYFIHYLALKAVYQVVLGIEMSTESNSSRRAGSSDVLEIRKNGQKPLLLGQNVIFTWTSFPDRKQGGSGEKLRLFTKMKAEQVSPSNCRVEKISFHSKLPTCTSTSEEVVAMALDNGLSALIGDGIHKLNPITIPDRIDAKGSYKLSTGGVEIPILYAITQHKNITTYRTIFGRLREIISEHPRPGIVLDFEKMRSRISI
ncbi:hypothetical protein Y032_0001g295 [Ancylostoma ceylanicum]|uniref:Uncharacterized protein n=2 Tax=Ancylostoma ceylanicum TaxID=53326 RepID=A0A016W4G9_9BILA|nr:hypothetical protein Y032_0001g295 [Ancylostoma ceylanicum]